MKKSAGVNFPRWKRSVTTGQLVGVRLQAGQIKAIDVWAAKRTPPVTRPEAIRRMVDAMLHILAKDRGEKQAKKAANSRRAQELAAKTIDTLTDPSAPPEERALRRRRLTKGLSEFREHSVDLPKAKK
jgi:hypothetical protein